MKESEVIEGNKLIAEFMGWKCSNNEDRWTQPDHSKVTGLYFHGSWDWLIPVVEKIENLREIRDFVISSVGCSILSHGFKSFISYDECDSKISAVYKSVVEFIKWHNSQNK